MLYLGLDLSLSDSGFYIIDGDGQTLVAESLSTKHYGVERLFFLRSKLDALLIDKDITLACYESAAYNENGRLFDLGCWAGIVMLYLYEHGIPFISAVPLQLKKYVSGVGKNKGKAIVMLDVYKNYGIEIRNDNIADAFVLANIARDYYKKYLLEEQFELLPHRSEVLKVIYKSESVNKNLII